VIGILPSTSGFINGEAVGGDEVFSLGRGAGRVERRVLQKPDAL
jgi:hypothetical protein